MGHFVVLTLTQVLRLMPGYDENNTLLLPPRVPGEGLPRELLDHYKHLCSQQKDHGSSDESRFTGVFGSLITSGFVCLHQSRVLKESKIKVRARTRGKRRIVSSEQRAASTWRPRISVREKISRLSWNNSRHLLFFKRKTVWRWILGTTRF